GSGGGGGTRFGIVFGRSDSCEASAAILTVRDTTDCLTLSATDPAWSISVNGQCRNIPHTNVPAARPPPQPNNTIIYGRSDSCEAETAVARVTPDTDCLRFSATDVAWSVSVNGQCRNISDTNVRAACLALQPSGTIIYGRSDSCEAEAAVVR